MPQRLAILTGGGDCPGLNAVIRAVAKTAILEHGAEVIGIEDGFEGLAEDRMRPLDYLAVSGILTLGGTILGASNRANPFSYPVESDGKVRFEDVSQRVAATFHSIHADALVVIGGDGSLTIASKLCGMGVACVGVPKTIDNDLFGTDQTFGFDSALVTTTDAADKLHTTAQAHHRVMILEVMGRNAGWLALGTGVAGGGDIILIPEIPYRLEAVRDYILKRRSAGKRFSIVVVAEGAKPLGGHVVELRRVADGSEPVRLGGIGNILRDDIEAATGIETRATILGHLQRGGSPSPFDRILASRLGREAAKLALSGRTGFMAGLRGTEIVAVPLEQIAGKQRLVEPNHHLLQTARSVGTCFGDGV
jgi:ATP-dependent phosphofructokinase / diphosphate-dependent phosphofructokinase